MNKRLRFAITVLVLVPTLFQACAVREQRFDCTNLIDKAVSEELVMTPTSMRFQSQAYSFREEVGTVRVYENKGSLERAIYNVASGQLQTPSGQWQCKKYTLSVEKA